MSNKSLQAAGIRTRLIPQGPPSALETFLERNITIHIEGLRVSGVLIGYTENLKAPHHRPAVLILETERGPTLVRGSWQKITLGGE